MSQDDGKKHSDGRGSSGGQNLLWYMAIAVLGITLVALYVANMQVAKIPYTDLVELIENSKRVDKYGDLAEGMTGDVIVQRKGTNGSQIREKFSNLRDVSVADRTVTGKIDYQQITPTPTDPKPIERSFRTNIVPSEGTIDELRDMLSKANISHSFDGEPGMWQTHGMMILLFGMVIVFFVVMMRRLGGAGSPMSFGRSRGKLYAQEDLGIMFDDVAGIDEAVGEVKEVVDFLRNAEKYQRVGGRIPKGVLLVGPPGTGKTLLAKAVAGEAGVPFFSLSGSDFVEMFVGVGAARVRDMFQQAESKAPCIIFIDELDALGKSRGSGMMGGHDEREQTLNALLVEMDGFASNSGVMVMAATNRPETLDPALLRPGRFDRQVLVDRPDISGREDILKVHVKSVKLGESVDIRKVASITPGFAGADLANLVNEAALLAARKEKNAVEMEEFNDGVERIMAGLEKKQRVMSDDEKRRVAYHESGHALIAYSLPNTDPIHKVSIIPRGFGALGYVLHFPDKERFLLTQSELESRIQVALGGTMAEELVYQDVSNGAGSDLEKATDIARRMVLEFGMSKMGRVHYREAPKNPFLGGAADDMSRSYSEKTAREIDEEVRRIIDEGLEKVRNILETRRSALEALTEKLIEVESIDADELREILDVTSPGPRIVPGTDAAARAANNEGSTAAKDDGESRPESGTGG